MKKDSQEEANKLLTDFCDRIERMCRYSALDTSENDEISIQDRNMVEALYCFYRKQGDSQKMSEKKAKSDAIRLVMCEAFA